MNGDGCSSTCTIEEEYVCWNNLPNTVSICEDQTPPTAILDCEYGDDSVMIKFHEYIETDLHKGNLTFTIGRLDEPEFSWELEIFEPKKLYKIKYDLST